MRINHNISALNANRQLKANDNAISKNLQRLSSGYRINSAADDAAGLAISEKMRAQINGLNQAESNAQDGISLVQTAEGALSESQSILQRMNELAVESANGTYQNGTDRKNLDKEINALKKEIDRISTSTNFNKINLLDGSLGTEDSQAVAKVELSNAVKGAAYGYTDATKATFATATVQASGTTAGNSSTFTVKYTNGESESTLSVTLTFDGAQLVGSNGATYAVATSASGASAEEMGAALKGELEKISDLSDNFSISNAAGEITFTANEKGSDGAKITGLTESTYDATNLTTAQAAQALTPTFGTDSFEVTKVTGLKIYNGTNAEDAIFTVNGEKFAFITTASDASKIGSDVHTVVASTTDASAMVAADAAKMSKAINDATGLKTTANSTNIEYRNDSSTTGAAGLTFQIGASNAKDQRVSLTIGDMSSKGLGISSVSIGSQEDALAALDIISNALDKVSETRADLGALQNRLEHSVNNLSTSSQNLTSAESRIRDVDMSSEMVELTKNQILEQAATSMLAQANSQPQSVLSLLKG
jgi:flagellin